MRIISRPAVPLALAALLAAGLTAGIAPEARAQGEAQAAAPANAEAAAIFRESASAMRSLKSLSAKVNLSGAGGFASVAGEAHQCRRQAPDPLVRPHLPAPIAHTIASEPCPPAPSPGGALPRLKCRGYNHEASSGWRSTAAL